ncbi:centrosomal protein of 89 kDa [Corythoichthys intestinalis]|uniref:centrosomal protein of 89 kDa n=1 Tax=Corythoichthys intestinalis TaxID=161448 RepID=UPI0025A5B2C3|nr:centrosomal protein of 89 kDa [Corythoichthys intestinalis]
MLKLNFWREKEKQFKHIAHGLLPAASIAPKAAVPRTPPPRSPAPSPERPRSALAAAILSSSLTGQTWALPPARKRALSESDQSESLISERNISTALYPRDRWSDGFAVGPSLSSPENSEEELHHQEAEEDEGVGTEKKEYSVQTLDTEEPAVDALPLKHLTNLLRSSPKFESSRESSPGFPKENILDLPKARKKTKKKDSISIRDDVPSTSQSKEPKVQSWPSHEVSIITKDGKEVKTLKEKNAMLQEKLQQLEEEVKRGRAQPMKTSHTGTLAELRDVRQQAQELVDENDALKRSVHRLSVELSAYQTKYRPLSKQEISRLSSLPKTGSPPPWLLDMKYLSPLMLAYDDMLNEKDALLCTAEEEVKKLRVHMEEVVKENERCHNLISNKTGGLSKEDCHQIQQQALLVLQENQELLEQLEALNAKNKSEHSKRQSEVSQATKQLMLLENEKERLQEEADRSRREANQSEREVLTLHARLKDAVTWEEHCSITGKLRRQLEQEQSLNRSKEEEVHILHSENQSLHMEKAKLIAAVERARVELESSRQVKRKMKRRLSALKQQKDECMMKEGKTRSYLEAVVSVADRISEERDQLLHMASILQQEKQGFIGSILSGTVRFGKLQERIKVYRRLASSRLVAVEKEAEGKAASHRQEILHLQRLLGERQQAEEKLLQSKREVEEELKVVWQAATRENQQIKETLWDSGCTGDSIQQAFAHTVSPECRQRLLDVHKNPQVQKSDQMHQQNLDFYN